MEKISPIVHAQEEKFRLLREGGSVVVKPVDVSLGFNISKKELVLLGERHQELVISPLKDGLFKISLRPQVEGWRKEILAEVVGFFVFQREQKISAREAYKNAYVSFQRQASQLGFDFGDLEFGQRTLSDLWKELSRVEQNSLVDQSPDRVLSSIGIIGSEE